MKNLHSELESIGIVFSKEDYSNMKKAEWNWFSLYPKFKNRPELLIFISGYLFVNQASKIKPNLISKEINRYTSFDINWDFKYFPLTKFFIPFKLRDIDKETIQKLSDIMYQFYLANAGNSLQFNYFYMLAQDICIIAVPEYYQDLQKYYGNNMFDLSKEILTVWNSSPSEKIFTNLYDINGTVRAIDFSLASHKCIRDLFNI